jgi:hypothetical protein
MAAGVTDRLWEIRNIVALLEADRQDREAERAQRNDWNGPTR